MCGIVGYLGNSEITSILLDGLKELEYRGYDSAGIAILQGCDASVYKAVGKIINLEQKIGNYKTEGFGVGIAHTRWATHGKPTEANAHPHSGDFTFVVHNGIIENYQTLKRELSSVGAIFVSQTDTEVIGHLFEAKLKNAVSSLEAFAQTVKALEGAYAILLATKAEPEKIYFAKKGSPLLVGRNGKGEKFFASSESPLIGLAEEVTYLNDGDWGVISPEKITLYQGDNEQQPLFRKLEGNRLSAQKEGFKTFMEKEIYEQTRVLLDTQMGRVFEDGIELEEISEGFFDGIRDIKICACGTSYHAGLVGSYLFERLAKIRCHVEIASELRYKEPLLTTDTLFIVISQSGETADTLEALKMAKGAGLKTLAICNVDNSSIVRMADATLLTRAGVEKGVASTKAFATQVMVLWMCALFVGKKYLTAEVLNNELSSLRNVKNCVKVDERLHEKMRRLSKRYLHGHGFFFIGRDIFYPLALEGALKLKEISYLHAEGYPAGEMKHGPIALADAELFTIALMPQTLLYDKIKSNVEELSARDSTILAISPQIFELADDQIQTHPHTHPLEEFFEMMVVTQLLALEIATRLGNDVDMPRNLAKSVTVE